MKGKYYKKIIYGSLLFMAWITSVSADVSSNTYDANNYKTSLNDGSVSCFEDTGDINLRKTPGGTKTGGTLSCGDIVTIHNIASGNSTCPYYYNVTNQNGESGYTCGIYINTIKLSTSAQNYYNTNGGLDKYYSILRSKGFPESYLPYLAEIHARHPNWNFEKETINLNFSDVVDNEDYGERNFVNGNSFDSNYYSTKYNYDILTNKFTYASEIPYYNASSEAIAYYLDPRTYLNDKYIFAFESLDFKTNQTADKLIAIISNTAYRGNNTFASEIYNAGKETGVSSFHLASSFSMEMGGVPTTDPRLGGIFQYGGTNKSGYYNFFNIKSSCKNCSSIYAGYAYEHGWDTTYKGLKGGASFLAADYISVNQDTMYYKKFDVSTTNGNYTHQFMQSISAIAAETDKSYNAYINKLSDYLNEDITFTIPVYNNMPLYHVTAPTVGNPNNYLKDIKIDGVTINGFSYDKYNYTFNVSPQSSNVSISATPVATTSSVSGLGKVSITSNDMNINIVVKAGNGKTRTYKINLKKVSGTAPDINTILNNSGVKYNNNYMYGISKNTEVNSLINNVTSISGYARINVYDKNNNIKNDGKFATGDKVVIGNTLKSNTYDVVLYGDVNGDGAIDKLDYLAVLRQYYGYANYTGASKIAADANHDGIIDKLDYLAVLRDYYGYEKIKQD